MDAQSSLMPSSFFERGVADQNQHCQQGSSAEIDKSAPPPAGAGAPTRRRNKLDSCAEVIALSPETLMATKMYVCEVCNKGFQRGQNLQLHKRAHNLPGKLKKKCKKEVKKKVYICPQSTCIYHEPTRALGDITAIKKHYSRKHGEKTYKCLKCAKMYANQCDWKAHTKTCGTREYRCDCGALFPRRNSFITHRAFCNIVSQETAQQPPNSSSRGSNINLGLSPISHPQNLSQEPIPISNDKLNVGGSRASPFDNMMGINMSSTFCPSQFMNPPAFFLPDSGHNYDMEINKGLVPNKAFNGHMELSNYPSNKSLNLGFYSNSDKNNSNMDKQGNGHVGGSSNGGGTNRTLNELIQLSDFSRNATLNLGFYFNSDHNNNSVEHNNNTDNTNSVAYRSPGGVLVQNTFSNCPVGGSPSGGGTNLFYNSLMGHQITSNVPSLFSASVSNPNIGGSAEMSATALLQKAAQMGSSSSSNASILRGFGSSSSDNANGFFGENNENDIQDIFKFLARGRGCAGGGACGGSSNICGVELSAYHNGVPVQKSSYNGTALDEYTPPSFMGNMADDGFTRDFLGVRRIGSGGGFDADREALAPKFQAFGDGNIQ